jgi:hypothetical protein
MNRFLGPDARPCPCGSGKSSWWLHDARGFECARVCPDCEEATRRKYRPAIFTDANYEADEPFDED